jgi:hypothetical protein
MKRIIVPVICLLLTGMLAPRGWAQDHDKLAAEEKAKSQEKRQDKTGSPVKIQVVFSEYDGDKKVKSLPYSFSINAMRNPDNFNPWTKLRVGSRVPITTGNGQLTYLDVGTSIDSRAWHTDDGRYSLQLNIERSSIDGEAITQSGQSKDPVVQQFKSELNITVREVETVESTFATDPLNGKVTKVQVTLTAVK